MDNSTRGNKYVRIAASLIAAGIATYCVHLMVIGFAWTIDVIRYKVIEFLFIVIVFDYARRTCLKSLKEKDPPPKE